MEPGAGNAEALLPRELAAELALGEHTMLSANPHPDAVHVGYGSALLDRLVAAATARVPFVSAKVTSAPARESQARAAADALVFRNGIFTVGAPRAASGRRLLAHAVFILHGDERREGLCAAAASLDTFGIVAGFEEAVAGVLEPAALDAPDKEGALRGSVACLAACADFASEAAATFREAMQRRFERDRDRMEGYFEDLLGELEKRAKRGKSQVADIREKRSVIERERAAKIEALTARYVMKVELRPVALLLVESPTYRMAIELRRRKASRTVEVEYDCATRRLVAPVCDGCCGQAPRPAACDDAVHLLCERCAPKSEGRIACPACRRKKA